MLHVWMPSGEQLAAFPVDDVPDVKTLKRRLCPLCGASRFRQRLLHAGADLPDSSRIDHPMDFNLVLLPFAESTRFERDELTGAAMSGKVADVERMLQRPQDPNQLGTTEYAFGEEDIEAPLACAARTGREEVVRLLLEALADPKMHGTIGPALQGACEYGYTGIVQSLLEHRADKNHVNFMYDPGETALDCACEIQRLDVVQALLEAGAERNDAMDITPLICASGRGKESNVSFLLSAPVHETANLGTALIAASSQGHEEIVRLLLEAQVDEELLRKLFPTVLFCATSSGNKRAERTVRVLLDFLAARGWACDCSVALACAEDAGQAEIASRLLQAHLSDGTAASLLNATRSGGRSMAEVLLETTARDALADTAGLALLASASSVGDMEAMNLLLQALADRGLGQGISPTAMAFLCAVHRGRFEAAERLFRSVAGTTPVAEDDIWALMTLVGGLIETRLHSSV